MIQFTEEERAELEVRGKEYTPPYRDVVRAKIVLLAGQFHHFTTNPKCALKVNKGCRQGC